MDAAAPIASKRTRTLSPLKYQIKRNNPLSFRSATSSTPTYSTAVNNSSFDIKDIALSPIIAAILSKKEYDKELENISEEEGTFTPELLFSDYDLKTDHYNYQNKEGIIEAWSWIDSVDSWMQEMDENDIKE